ncbi:hypothetical protein D3C72_1565740 [compost metagenome]
MRNRPLIGGGNLDADIAGQKQDGTAENGDRLPHGRAFARVGEAEILTYRRQDNAGHDGQMPVVKKIMGNLRFFFGVLGFSRSLLLPVMKIDPPHRHGADESRAEDDECQTRIHIFRGRAPRGEDRFPKADDDEKRTSLRQMLAGKMQPVLVA